MNRRIAKPASQPARKSLTAVSLSIAALFAVPAAHAFELKLEDGWKGSLDTTVSLGTSWRMQSADPKLYSAADGARIPGIPTGTGGSNTDSGNLNWDKGDQFSTLLKVTSDLSLSKGDMGAFARVKAWYDYALKDGDVRAGNLGNNYTRNSPLSDSGFERLQKFSGIALLDAYAYNTFDMGGNPLQIRLGNQVINWGESVFVQGLNIVSPIDLSALRKPGAEIKDAFLPIPAISMNLGLEGGKSLEAFYQFSAVPSNIDSCGTYFGAVETKLSNDISGPCGRMLVSIASNNASAFTSGLYVPLSSGRESDDGQMGLNFKFALEAIDSEVGLYAARVNSRLPVVSGVTGDSASLTVRALQGLPGVSAGNQIAIALNTTFAPGGPFGLSGLQTLNAVQRHATALGLRPFTGFWEYPEKLDIFGASLGTNLAGWSVGVEASHIPNYPAQINGNDLLSAALRGEGPMGAFVQQQTILGAGREISGFREVSKSQLQVNGVKIFPRLLGSVQGVFVGEVAFQKANVGDSYNGLRYGRAFIFGSAKHSTTPGSCGTNPQTDGCENDGFATENSWGYRARLGLEYPNFLNTGATLFPTFSFSHDVSGYSVDNQFIEDRKVYGASFRFNIQRVHNVELSYIQYGDSAKYDPFRDRDFMSLVFSTSF